MSDESLIALLAGTVTAAFVSLLFNLIKAKNYHKDMYEHYQSRLYNLLNLETQKKEMQELLIKRLDHIAQMISKDGAPYNKDSHE